MSALYDKLAALIVKRKPPDDEPKGTKEPNTDTSASVSSAMLSPVDVENGNEETQCGCGSCRPHILQPMAKAGSYLSCISAIVLTQSLLVSGYISSILTTIEKRFDLASSESGLIISSYDMTCIIAVVLVSYFGDRRNRAQWIGRGALIMSVGAIGFTLPHLFGTSYTGGNFNSSYDNNLCNSTRATPNVDMDCNPRNPETWALAIFLVSMMIIGIGASPIYTLGPTYLYDNVKPHLYSMYAGIMYSMSALGPALGFLIGAGFLSAYVEWSGAPKGMDESHAGWIGAWWAGFWLCSLFAFISAVPLLFFPKRLPTSNCKAEKQESPSFIDFGDLKEIPRKVLKLLKNPTWLFISLALVAEQSISTGFIAFIAKYFQVSFAITASKANMITGAVIIPGAFTGMLAGGWLMKKLQLDMASSAKLLMCMSIIPAIGLVTLLFLGCQNIDLAGITSGYNSKEFVSTFHVNYKANPKFLLALNSSCNANCKCERETNYQPVCGENMITYYSPCHAGCTKLHIYTLADGTTVRNYSSCACIYEDFVHQTQDQGAKAGKCDTECYNIIPFLILLFIIVFITSCGQNPVLLITLRSVDAGNRSFCLGIQSVLVRALAFIPAPVYFGKALDTQCLLWTQSCDGNGSCLEYKVKYLPFAMFGTCLALKSISFIFLFLNYITAKRRPEKSVVEVEVKFDKDESPKNSNDADNKLQKHVFKMSPTRSSTCSSAITVSTVCSKYSVSESRI